MIDILELERRKDVGGLIDALGDSDKDILERLESAEAAKALGRIGDERAVEPLITALDDEDVSVRVDAVIALDRIGDKRAVEPLITALLGDEEENVRSCAAQALGEIGDKKAVEPLITALADSDEDVRMDAAYALGKIGDDRAVEPLITALGDEYFRRERYLIGKITDQSEYLIPILGKENEYGHLGAAGALGVIGDKRAVQPLITALGGGNWYIRTMATYALGKIGDERAVEPLITALENEDKDVRWNAAEALGKIGDPRAIPALENATGDSDEDVRKQAEEAIDKIKSRVEEAEPKIILKSKSEYHGANIDFKVRIENQLDHSIADVKATIFVPQVFLLGEKEKTIGLIKPKERQTTTFTIRPTGECGDCVIEGEVTYYDTASGSHERIKIKPKLVAVKCAILKRFKTEDDAWFDITANLISTKETHEDIPVPAGTLFNVATHALLSMGMFMLKPARNSAPGYFSGSARYAALGAVGGMKYTAQLNVIGSEAGSSRLVLEAWAEEESALVGFYHRMLDRLEEQTRVKEYVSSVFIAGDYVSGQKQVAGGDVVSDTKITGDVVATRSTIGGGGGGKPFLNCPHCGEALNLAEVPKFCPYCGGQMR